MLFKIKTVIDDNIYEIYGFVNLINVIKVAVVIFQEASGYCISLAF